MSPNSGGYKNTGGLKIPRKKKASRCVSDAVFYQYKLSCTDAIFPTYTKEDNSKTKNALKSTHFFQSVNYNQFGGCE